MAGGKFSLANLYGITLRESADDGSDFTNPDADYRRVFLGEDGELHKKDSSGTVTGFAGSGISPTIVDAKGDIIAATAADTVARLAAGANGARLEAASGQSTGLAWHALTTVDAILGGDVTMVNATTYYDGPSASFGAGTWLVMAQTMVKVTVTTSQTYAWHAKLWDGSTVYAEAFDGQRAAANYQNWAWGMQTMIAIVVLGGTTTVKTSVESLRGSSASAIARTETGIFANGLNLGTRIVGYRLAL